MMPESPLAVLGNFVAWIVFGITILVPLLARACQRDQRVALVVWTGVLMHQALAMNSAYITGLSSDARDMHTIAVGMIGEAKLGLSIGGYFYVQLLAATYEILGAAPFLGQQLSILAYTLSCLAFLKVAEELSINRRLWLLLALYALPLSMLRYTSTMIREAYQVLFFIVALLYAVRFKERGSPVALLLSALFAFAMGIFHDGLIMYTAGFVALTVIWPTPHDADSPKGARRQLLRRMLLTAPLVLGLGFVGYRLVTRGIGNAMALNAVMSNRALEYAARYREGGLAVQARTNYPVRLDPSSPAAFVRSLGAVFVYYMFSPFPWQIQTPEDVYGAAESLLRLGLLIAAAVAVKRTQSRRRRWVLAMMMVAYFALAGLWSIGTVNYGTAIRHHITTTWILILIGGPLLLDTGASLLRRVSLRRSHAPLAT